MLTEELLGRRVRAAREQAGLTQGQLAAQIGVDQPTISRFEKGRDIGSILLTKIAEATGHSLDFFLRPSQAVRGVLFRKGGADVETLSDAAQRMLELVEDYELVQLLARE